MDASDFAIGGVLMQDRHPIAFKSHKLNDMEMCYTMQENEMTAIVHCLCTWRHYLLGSHFITDGQAERVNVLLELYLRHLVSANQKDCAKLLDITQFSYNLQRSEATNKSLFKLAIRQQPLTSHTLTIGYMGRTDIARSYLDKATKKMKKWADKKRHHTEYKVGDMVLVKLLSQQFKSLRLGLVRRYEGPFPILGKVNKVSYKVELPLRLKIHHVFHVSYLKPYHEDKDDPSRGFSKRAPTAVVTSYDKEVEHIIANGVIRR
ncbi:hypothetical protein AAG906_017404 [Vitis piasezkii]